MFTPENWNCATIEALLEVAADTGHETVYGCDESLDIVPARKDRDFGGFLVLTRYKRRGKTSSAVHVGDFWPGNTLTLRQALIALGEVNPDDDE